VLPGARAGLLPGVSLISPSGGIGAPESPNGLREIDELAAEILAGWNGLGELHGGASANNRGRAIDGWREYDGTGGPIRVAGAWCAVVQAAADVRAAAELGFALPYKTSRSAKRYTSAVAECGWWVVRPRGPWGMLGVDHIGIPRPGDRVCWHRGDPDRPSARRQGHVARVVRYIPGSDVMIVREGNRNNRRDSQNRRYAVVGEREVTDWQTKLYGVARLG